METNEKKTTKKCYLCGKDIKGKKGQDYQIVKTRWDTKYYCSKCVEDLQKGAL